MGEVGRGFLDRAQAAVGDDGRLPLGAMTGPFVANVDARSDEVRAALAAH